jgi:hypothetical protein
MICQCCGRLFAQMPTKKYCQKCRLIGPRKEAEEIRALKDAVVTAALLGCNFEDFLEKPIQRVYPRGIAELEKRGQWPPKDSNTTRQN